MKRTLAIAAGLALLTASSAQADNTDTATVNVTGTLITALTMSKTSDLTMPNLVVPGAGDPSTYTSVTLTCGTSDAGNSVSYGFNGNPYAHGNTAAASTPSVSSANYIANNAGATGICAQLTVSGETGYSFLLSTSAVTGSIPNVSITSPRCTTGGSPVDSTSPAVILSGGTIVRCGASLRANSGAAPGAYSGAAFTVTVTYD